MGLKLLQPSLRPIGQFDIEDDDRSNLSGGEIMTLAAIGADSDYYAADVEGMGEGVFANFTVSSGTIRPIFLADDGIKGYGTLFGELIGSTVGQATSQSGATVIGPHTVSGSGKVTLWHSPGLYAVSTPADRSSPAGGTSDAFSGSVASHNCNDQLQFTAAGKHLAATNSGFQVGAMYIGGLSDDSLVSTTLAAAGETAVAEHEVIYFLGTSSVTVP